MPDAKHHLQEAGTAKMPVLAYPSTQQRIEVVSEPGRLTIALPPSPQAGQVAGESLMAGIFALLAIGAGMPLVLHWFSRPAYTLELVASPFAVIFALLMADSLLRIWRMARGAPMCASIVIDGASVSISGAHRGSAFCRTWPRQLIAAVFADFSRQQPGGACDLRVSVTWMSGNRAVFVHRNPPLQATVNLQALIEQYLPSRTPQRGPGELSFRRWF